MHTTSPTLTTSLRAYSPTSSGYASTNLTLDTQGLLVPLPPLGRLSPHHHPLHPLLRPLLIMPMTR
ncbi:hypothetical protein GW17_00060443 [Ensete ventricosum]|nr:hypothetical protein GW17_00060443 [Ensete ventricosum]RZR97985.1 hypothetical protein BHM03_00027274 [Ensete ventricosum]